MSLLKVKDNFQITIPAALRKKYKVSVGDYVEAEDSDDGIIIRPVKIIRPDDAWFHTEEWQKGEKEADKALLNGEVVGPFDSIKDALNALKTAKV